MNDDGVGVVGGIRPSAKSWFVNLILDGLKEDLEPVLRGIKFEFGSQTDGLWSRGILRLARSLIVLCWFSG